MFETLMRESPEPLIIITLLIVYTQYCTVVASDPPGVPQLPRTSIIMSTVFLHLPICVVVGRLLAAVLDSLNVPVVDTLLRL